MITMKIDVIFLTHVGLNIASALQWQTTNNVFGATQRLLNIGNGIVIVSFFR